MRIAVSIGLEVEQLLQPVQAEMSFSVFDTVDDGRGERLFVRLALEDFSSIVRNSPFFCPSRQTRTKACWSAAGFQSGSKRTSRFAPMRLMPQPPVLLLRRNTNSSPSEPLNFATSFVRFVLFIVPSSLKAPWLGGGE